MQETIDQTPTIDPVESDAIPYELSEKRSQNNGLGTFLKSRERVFFKYGRTYNVGKNKAKREARGK